MGGMRGRKVVNGGHEGEEGSKWVGGEVGKLVKK